MCFEWFPGRFPTEIQAEIDRLPCGFVDEMIESFAFARAVSANDANVPGWETSPLRTLARQIEMDIAQEQIDSHG